MAIEIDTKVSIGELYGKMSIPNITLENAKFYGRPNFSGEMDKYKDDRRKFTVLIPEDVVLPLQALGYNVRQSIPKPEDEDQIPNFSLKVMLNFRFDEKHPGDVEYEKGPDIFILQGDQHERLTSKTVGLLDRSRIQTMDMEIRGWEYDRDDNPGKYSARLVSLVVTLVPSILEAKYGRLA